MQLFKFLPPERIDNLRTLLFRYSQPAALNDPFEAKTNPPDPIEKAIKNAYKGQLQSQRTKLSFEKWKQKNPSLVEQFQSAFDQEGYNQVSVADRLSKRCGQFFGFLSLSEHWTSVPMWSHYAANHSGFAVTFDTNHEYFRGQPGQETVLDMAYKVKYDVNRPEPLNILSYEDMQKTSVENIFLFTYALNFFVKNLEWSYENEWRIIKRIEDLKLCGVDDFGLNIYLGKIPEECVSAVILGANASACTREKIIDATHSSHFPKRPKLYDAKLAPDTFRLLVEEVVAN